MLDFNKNSEIQVFCPRTAGAVTQMELEALDFKVDGFTDSSVATQGSLLDCIRINWRVRSAYRVLWKYRELVAVKPDLLYNKAKQIPWEEFIHPDAYISIDSFVRNDFIRDDRFANVRLKDAIADRFMEKFGRRPDAGNEKTGVVIFMRWINEKVELFIDTSGETIAKHGYRKVPYNAPLMESLAAAIILATQWDRKSPFINPMCGSGTLAIEAALIATNRYPLAQRSHFAYQQLIGFRPEMELGIRMEMPQVLEHCPPILANDHDPQAISAARKNAQLAGVEHLITFQEGDFQEIEVPEEPGVVILNPEYGERLGEEEELVEVYKSIGDFFKQKCAGYWGYVFTGNLQLGKRIGLKTKRRLPFFNARIECRLLEFELFKGSKYRERSEINEN